MNLVVTQDNLYLFMLSEDSNVSIVKAVEMIYSSDTYRKLEKEESKLWHLGPVGLYRDFLEEK